MTTPGDRPVTEREALLRRTRALAARHAAPEAARGEALLVFRRGGERLGVPMADVAAVLRDARLTPIPMADPPVIGVVTWRNQPLTVYDAAQARGAPARGAPSAVAPVLIVVGEEWRAAGLVADEVEDTTAAAPATAAAATVPDEGAAPGRPLVRVVTADAIGVVDVATLLMLFFPA